MRLACPGVTGVAVNRQSSGVIATGLGQRLPPVASATYLHLSVPGWYGMEPRRVRRALPPAFERKATGLVFSPLPPESLVCSTEATRATPNIGRNQYSTGIWSGGRTRSSCLADFVDVLPRLGEAAPAGAGAARR